jgi:hypothetical protein
MKRSTTEDVIRRFREIHGDTYDYSDVVYVNTDTKVTIICPEHGRFEITPYHHSRRKQGCYLCGVRQRGIRQRKTLDEFVVEARKVHGYRYDYSKAEYINAHTKIEIICSVHGSFFQTPDNHRKGSRFTGNGCPSCTIPGRKSKRASMWLDSLDIIEREFRIPENPRLTADGFDAKTRTVYFFHGDYWHGNPEKYDRQAINPHNGKQFGQLYDRTVSIEHEISGYGYNLVTIWESDWVRSRRETSRSGQ